MRKNLVTLIVLDGWGVAPEGRWNAIASARTPNMDAIEREFGSLNLCASGACVGLTPGQIGNSEVGHLTIGAGRVVPSDLVRVNRLIKEGKLGESNALEDLLADAIKKESAVHFLGLVSNGGVHSHIDHLFALLGIAARKGATRIFVHTITDGRDTPPKSGAEFIISLVDELKRLGTGRIATLSGRYYAMDRDNRWKRTQLAYNAIVCGKGPRFDDAIAALERSYEEGKTDEFVLPRVIGDYSGFKDGDAVIFFNFRPDRARQLTRTLLYPKRVLNNVNGRKKIELLTMTVYDQRLKGVPTILQPLHVGDTLGDVLERSGVSQLRVAETEKYAHATYFFNGLEEKPVRKEKRILVRSNRKVKTYDKIPAMRAKSITEKVAHGINSGRYGFILVNYANADMVGHTGKLGPTKKAIEVVDSCIGELFNLWKKMDSSASSKEAQSKVTILITGDHGKAEQMRYRSTDRPRTAHTSNPVPFIVVSRQWEIAKKELVEEGERPEAGLCDIAPSVLKILGIKKPAAMTGRSIVESIIRRA